MMHYIHACATGRWHLEMWRRSDPTIPRRHIVYKCRSWRHEGECREWCGACDFSRIETAMKKHRGWVYLVLTYAGDARKFQRQTFKNGVDHWYSLRKRIERDFGKCRYIQTWEIQADGTPHLNVLIQCKRLFLALSDAHRQIKQGWLAPAAVASGFGHICYCQAVKCKRDATRYLTKTARELTGAGEKCQVPINAPRHFRRIRASRGLLPPRKKDPDVTGRLIQMPIPPPPPSGLHAHGQLE